MKKKIFYYLIFISIISNGQSIQKIIKLDTIINTQIVLESTWEKVTTTVYDNKIWMYRPQWNGNDSIMFIRYDLKTLKGDTIIAYVPNLYLRIKNPQARCLSVNENYLVITFTDAMLVFNNVKGQLTFNKIFPIAESYNYLKINDKMLVCGKVYNHHPLTDPYKTALVIYDLKKDTFPHYLNPYFNDIEFSHFGGNHWIDSYNDKILFSQTTEYSINIYNTRLDSIENINRKNIKHWKAFNHKITKRLSENIAPEDVKELIDSLTPYHLTISRIEGAYFIDDTTIIVRYIPVNSKKNNKRMYDVWRKNKQWILLHSDLSDEDTFNSNEIISKENFSLEGYAYQTFVLNNTLISIRAETDIYPIGKNQKNYNKEKEKYYIKNNPKVMITIFKIKI